MEFHVDCFISFMKTKFPKGIFSGYFIQEAIIFPPGGIEMYVIVKNSEVGRQVMHL